MNSVFSASTIRLAVLITGVLTALPVARAIGQSTSASPALTLADAWAKAEAKSDQLVIAAARKDHARGSAHESGSLRRPRLAAYSAYDRTLRSEFEGIMGFEADSAAPTSEESAEIPFGSAHAYRAGLTASYTVFSGGRSLALGRAAASATRAAEYAFSSARAALRLEVTEAYYDAMLADRLHRIAEWTQVQAESTYRRVSTLATAGRAPEFDVVRAKASRDRQVPVVIRHAADREIAMLRLRQLLHLPGDAELGLPSEFELPVGRSASANVVVAHRASARTAVREASEAVIRGEHMVSASQAGRLPALTLTSTYERVAYPLSGTPDWNNSRANWTVGARVDVPILTGGKQRGSDEMARAELDAARARLRLTEQLAELDSKSAAARLTAAEAAWAASGASVGEATRAYEIAALRFREGVSIQLELSDSRLALDQARADQARAARDLLIERVRVTLLPDLPLSATRAAP